MPWVDELSEPKELRRCIRDLVDGMGLGLSICRSIVEAHRVKRGYEPNSGGGAIFRMTLPVSLER